MTEEEQFEMSELKNDVKVLEKRVHELLKKVAHLEVAKKLSEEKYEISKQYADMLTHLFKKEQNDEG